MWHDLRQRYNMRWERRWRVARGRWKLRDLTPTVDRTRAIRPRDLLVFATVRDERARLEGFLKHYRRIGIAHFLVVDNGSSDGTGAFLADQPDVSIWATEASYRGSRWGGDWLNGLLCRYGHGHWTLTVDADEFLVYPFCDRRPLHALTDWLEACGERSMSAMLIDLYPGGPGASGALEWFDAGNYVISLNPRYRNLWIQGGPRMRAYFADDPWFAPALNKIPLVHWDRRFAYVTSTHSLLPRGLNRVYGETGGEKTCGALMHLKFGSDFASRAATEVGRGEHFRDAGEYRRYAAEGPEMNLWTPQSTRYEGWQQLDALGLMSRGGWA
jgi:hypothetical protein